MIKDIIKVSSAVVILLTFLAYLCPHVHPSQFRWLTFIGVGFPWLAIFNICLLIFWWWRTNRFALYHLGILLIGWEFIISNYGCNFQKVNIPENSLSIATNNIGTLYYKKKRITQSVKEKTIQQYATFLLENGNPDILCTQETRGDFYHELAKKLNYSYTFNLRKGTVIYSRYPLEAGGEILHGTGANFTANSILWADVILPHRKIRVYNVHLESNHVTSETEAVLETKELEKEVAFNKIETIINKVGSATRIRAQQADQLKRHILNCPYPVLVCGDFNDTPNSYVYRTLLEVLNDGFLSRGWGVAATYAGGLPFLRIDYIMTDRKIEVYSYSRKKHYLSDHHPVFAEIGI